MAASLEDIIRDLEKTVAILETRLQAAIDARNLQAKEYERRLSELNHAHESQIQRNAEYVSRSVWDLKNAEFEKWRREVDMWRWIAIGVGIAGGGISSAVIRILTR